MALQRSSVSRRGSKNDTEKEEEEQENNGYIQVLVKPLEPGNCSYLLSWFGVNSASFSPQQVTIFYVSAILVSTFFLYQIIRCDFGSLFQRLCGLFVPMFSIVCAFYWLSLYLRKTWSVTSVYILFISCFVGEAFAQLLFCGIDSDPSPAASAENQNSLSPISHPSVIFIVLLVISTASVFSSLEATYSATVILLVSFTRFLSCSTLVDLPQSLRPYISYSCGLAGIFVSKYMETVLRPPINNYMTQDGKIPVIKRRRSSSSNAHAFQTHRSTRRTSLPALIQKSQNSSASYDAAIIGEAHGLITDMLADSSLPPHVVSGLRAVSNLLKPPESHSSIHKQRVSPLVSLTESTSYGSDSEENPYTGERPSSLPKRLRRSLPPSLIRRMSTSTWTTTTSATGMPTLEPEPCRMRSSSFRHSRDSTPNTSPQGSRSNSPSPSSPTTVVLTIPKSRSFSMASPLPANQSQQKRFSRKSTPMYSSDEGDRQISPLAKLEVEVEELDEKHITLPKDPHFASIRRLNITSDYESNDSPSSSDHSDNLVTSEDLSVSPPRKEIFKDRVRIDSGSIVPAVVEEKTEEKSQTSQSECDYLFDLSDIEDCSLLDVGMLNDWDFPIFDLSETVGNFILTKVAYRLFTEVGLFETFRIPVPEFLKYFHALELGYRDKPYHNRVHATDVLHGVYFITTQPIPGFQQVNISDIMSRHASSGESGDNVERSSFTQRHSVSGDDSYGIMGANIPPLELMALYTAAAMHDYDHPGRTNAFLVATHASQAVLYNDRSVLENHHAAAAWNLFLSDRRFNFLSCLDQSEFKRFRFLVIESILATDLKRHFEILAEFNAKVNDDEAPGVDWTVETDRLLVSQMVIKMADINGPAKRRDLHMRWTMSISEEFYEQGDEESRLGMPISPYMDRKNQQLAKLQETFINHLVAPLCNAMVTGGLIPGTWVEDESDAEGMSDTDKGESTCKDTEDEDNDDTDQEVIGGSLFVQKKNPRKINCALTKNMKENHDYWAKVVEAENLANKIEKEGEEDDSNELITEKKEMEPITEESESPTMKDCEHAVQRLDIQEDKNTNNT